MEKIKQYYRLAKPGMVYGNIITAIAGYFLASKLNLKPIQFIAMVLGISFVMGSACAINNLIDRDIDSVMQRTKKRPSVNGSIKLSSGVIYAIILTILGFSLLFALVNILTVAIGLVGFIDYAFVYTLLKRKTYHATLIGSIAGAMPIMGGYVAFSDHISITALIVGLMMLFWQMPHFYAIALYREDDYRKANIPLLPIVKNQSITAKSMFVYNLLFIAAALSLYFYAALNIWYLIVLGTASIVYLAYSYKGLRIKHYTVWARQSFKYSLLLVLVMSVAVALG